MDHIHSSEGTNFTATQQISHSSPRFKWSVPFRSLWNFP